MIRKTKLGTGQRTYDHTRKAKHAIRSKEGMYYLETEVIRDKQRTGRKEQVRKAGRKKMIHSMFCPELGPVGHLPPYFINCQLHNLHVNWSELKIRGLGHAVFLFIYSKSEQGLLISVSYCDELYESKVTYVITNNSNRQPISIRIWGFRNFASNEKGPPQF